ncbi:MAG TPA: efflux RND transporter periplasmic adaptor subunit [Candidatus Paceibacterota bacterium]|nr:efflux RND transporter periplasmic adaptor subunit [Verrucomicrobiota bacterium]HSA08765.1 efflux RND transporter periplasmic adaptor subunit [Candidatus Paceibacterota bacterium]
MNANILLDKLPAPMRRHPVLSGIAGLALLALVVLWLWPAKPAGEATAYHEVKRGDFTVSVVEGGTLSAVSEIIIRSEVEGTARIISIVPEGSYVKKGDLLIELDSATAQDQVNLQEINYEKAKFAVEQALAQLEIQKSATNSEYLAAQLKLKLARIDLEKYEQGQRLVDLVEASNKLVQAQAQLVVNTDTYRNSTNLAAKGYETKQKVDGDRLTVLNSANALIVASNSIWMLRKFDEVKQLETYRAQVLQAEQELERVVNQNARKMAQYAADLITQSNTLALSEQKLERDRKNLAATTIRAPQDGLVVYQVSDSHFSSESLVEGGAVVRNRQELIKLPDLSRMKVVIKVHESHVNMIRPGLPAFIMLDSMPDERFRGVVEKVAPLPDTQSRWGNPNLKVYNTEIYLIDTVPNVKPGVSAKAEIIVTNIADALSVPIQAIATHKGNPVAYVVKGHQSEPRPVEVGMFNTKYIEITKGLNPGDRVLLSPPFEIREKDLEGGVLAEDEKASAATNTPPRATPGPDTPRTSPGGPVAAANSDAKGEDSRRRASVNPQEMLRQFDKDGDGKLDDTEREAMRAAVAARLGGEPGGARTNTRPRLNREEALKQFDKNGDGKLDEDELAAMREGLGRGRGGQGKGPGTRGSGAAGDTGGEAAPRPRTPAS